MHELQQALTFAGFKTWSYSGRGMYGKSCLATSTDATGIEVGARTIAAAAEYGVTEYLESLAEEMANARSDSLGMNTVYYWPGIPYEGKDDEDEDEDEE